MFGRDLVFTFGPYASVYSREYNPGTNTIALFGSFCLATAFVVQFLRWALRDERRMLPVWVVMAVIALFNQKDAVFLIYPTCSPCGRCVGTADRSPPGASILRCS